MREWPPKRSCAREVSGPCIAWGHAFVCQAAACGALHVDKWIFHAFRLWVAGRDPVEWRTIPRGRHAGFSCKGLGHAKWFGFRETAND